VFKQIGENLIMLDRMRSREPGLLVRSEGRGDRS
jgi:hypothetical protein